MPRVRILASIRFWLERRSSTLIQSVVSRNVDPLKSAVVSICMFRAGNTDNVIPQTVQLRGTARSLAADVRDLLEKRLHAVVESTARGLRRESQAHAIGVAIRCWSITNGRPNSPHRSRAQIAGQDKVDTSLPPMMGAEDFSFMLNARPGAFIWVGNGDSAGLHHPAYNFNDEAIPFGTSYWVKLVETALAA